MSTNNQVPLISDNFERTDTTTVIDRIRGIDELQQAINRSIQRMHEVAQEAFRGLSQIAEVGQSLQRSIDKLPDMLIPILKNFSQYGWYVNHSFDFIQIAVAQKILNGGDEKAFDVFLSDIISKDVDKYVFDIGERHPNRMLACSQALQAHKLGLYYTAIPTVFAQIDGLAEELTGVKFFENENKNKNYAPKIATWAATAGSFSIENALLSVLLDKGAFQKYRTDNNRITVTRHSILHGETCDYGTKVNSLKAFSLLMFVSDMCYDFRRVPELK